jgi:rubrerythrin
MELKGSKTEQNLMMAFAGEAQAYIKYLWFAKQAQKDGYIVVRNVFNQTAGNEEAHAKLWFKYLNGGGVPATLDNLKAAWEGENFEWASMYKDFAAVAEEEGFTEIAAKMRLVGNVELHHRDRYQTMIDWLDNGEMFKKPEKVKWICLNCGYITEAETAPVKCPICSHPQAWFQELIDYNC